MRAYTVKNIYDAKFKTLDVQGKWLQAFGTPELTGTWFIYGASKNGKTSFAMMLSKYLTGFQRVAYNSVEEGISLSIQQAVQRAAMHEVGGKWILLNNENFDTLDRRLSRHKSPNVILIDSVQFAEMQFAEYKYLKNTYPKKLFIYISHVDLSGRNPEGKTAIRILRDASVSFRIEGFKAFPISRYGGGAPITINKELAQAYWGNDN